MGKTIHGIFYKEICTLKNVYGLIPIRNSVGEVSWEKNAFSMEMCRYLLFYNRNTTHMSLVDNVNVQIGSRLYIPNT